MDMIQTMSAATQLSPQAKDATPVEAQIVDLRGAIETLHTHLHEHESRLGLALKPQGPQTATEKEPLETSELMNTLRSMTVSVRQAAHQVQSLTERLEL